MEADLFAFELELLLVWHPENIRRKIKMEKKHLIPFIIRL
jgi:hypothetical protein